MTKTSKKPIPVNWLQCRLKKSKAAGEVSASFLQGDNNIINFEPGAVYHFEKYGDNTRRYVYAYYSDNLTERRGADMSLNRFNAYFEEV